MYDEVGLTKEGAKNAPPRDNVSKTRNKGAAVNTRKLPQIP